MRPNPWFDVLLQYGAGGVSIGYGSSTTYLLANQAATVVTDADIRAALIQMIDTGQVPPPGTPNNNYYAFHFPPTVTVNQFGSIGCQSWCGYHGTLIYNDGLVYYGVMPDLSSASCTNCFAGSENVLAIVQAVASHEVAEAVTDPGVGLGEVAWYNNVTGQEVADQCEQVPINSLVLGDGQSYYVASLWSNADMRCMP